MTEELEPEVRVPAARRADADTSALLEQFGEGVAVRVLAARPQAPRASQRAHAGRKAGESRAVRRERLERDPLERAVTAERE
ncbi:hypothetical protein GCM10009792_25750 [Microcella alkalica]